MTNWPNDLKDNFEIDIKRYFVIVVSVPQSKTVVPDRSLSIDFLKILHLLFSEETSLSSCVAIRLKQCLNNASQLFHFYFLW